MRPAGEYVRSVVNGLPTSKAFGSSELLSCFATAPRAPWCEAGGLAVPAYDLGPSVDGFVLVALSRAEEVR